MLSGSLQTVFIVYIGGLIAIITFKLLAGRINTRGLLVDKATQKFSPGRLQLLLVTLGGASFYVLKIVDATNTVEMPQVPEIFLLIVGGSNIGYLGGKIYSNFLKTL